MDLSNITKLADEINSYLKKVPVSAHIPIPTTSFIPEQTAETIKKQALESTIPFLQSLLRKIKASQQSVNIEFINERLRFIREKEASISDKPPNNVDCSLIDRVSAMEQRGINELEKIRLNQSTQETLFSRIKSCNYKTREYEEYVANKIRLCKTKNYDSKSLKMVYEYLTSRKPKV